MGDAVMFINNDPRYVHTSYKPYRNLEVGMIGRVIKITEHHGVNSWVTESIQVQFDGLMSNLLRRDVIKVVAKG